MWKQKKIWIIEFIQELLVTVASCPRHSKIRKGVYTSIEYLGLLRYGYNDGIVQKNIDLIVQLWRSKSSVAARPRIW